MKRHFIRIAKVAGRNLLATHNKTPRGNGWRSIVWTTDPEKAAKFSSAGQAELIARNTIPHGQWDVVELDVKGL